MILIKSSENNPQHTIRKVKHTMAINLSLISSDYLRQRLNEHGLVNNDGNLTRRAVHWLKGVPMEEWDMVLKINLACLDNDSTPDEFAGLLKKVLADGPLEIELPDDKTVRIGPLNSHENCNKH